MVFIEGSFFVAYRICFDPCFDIGMKSILLIKRILLTLQVLCPAVTVVYFQQTLSSLRKPGHSCGLFRKPPIAATPGLEKFCLHLYPVGRGTQRRYWEEEVKLKVPATVLAHRQEAITSYCVYHLKISYEALS